MGQACICGHSQTRKPAILMSESSLEVLKVIGSGSFAQVKLAVLKATQTPVAVKVMNKAHLLKAKQAEHVFAERQILELMSSPFIVTFYGSFQDPANLYLVLEYVPGGELFHFLCERSTLSRSVATFYIAEVTMAFCALHTRRCAYRDLKPENVLISASGHVKLVDLGLAKVLFGEEKAYSLCGTPEYIPPEVIDGKGYNETCDWWQLGILLYEMITGRTPFTCENPYELYSNILTKKVEFTDKFDEVAKDFTAKLLHKSPAQRISQRDILTHGFFDDISWEEVKELGLTPPFVPTLSDPLDTSYFEHFKEKCWEEGAIEASLQTAFEGY